MKWLFFTGSGFGLSEIRHTGILMFFHLCAGLIIRKDFECASYVASGLEIGSLDCL